MPKLTLSNLYSGKPYMVWLEPYAEDYWIPPQGELSIEFEDADFTKGVIRDGPFDVSWVDEGVVVWPAALSGVIVRGVWTHSVDTISTEPALPQRTGQRQPARVERRGTSPRYR
ncbi:hypothetical protein ACFWPH_34695 [Nocardia sp. NPDC058499]|uniref:hypothetical protein n=1 Tax=Nocardia sp. NPDC058499 TaxID=3346530 RepID=UPI003660F5C0